MNLKLVVKYRVPSLNRLFAMNHWERAKERRKAHLALLSALSPTDTRYLTQTTSAQRALSTAYGTLALYLATGRKTSNSRSRKRGVTRKMSELKSP